jgi:hypothetical protein
MAEHGFRKAGVLGSTPSIGLPLFQIRPQRRGPTLRLLDGPRPSARCHRVPARQSGAMGNARSPTPPWAVAERRTAIGVLAMHRVKRPRVTERAERRRTAKSVQTRTARTARASAEIALRGRGARIAPHNSAAPAGYCGPARGVRKTLTRRAVQKISRNSPCMKAIVSRKIALRDGDTPQRQLVFEAARPTSRCK